MSNNQRFGYEIEADEFRKILKDPDRWSCPSCCGIRQQYKFVPEKITTPLEPKQKYKFVPKKTTTPLGPRQKYKYN